MATSSILSIERGEKPFKAGDLVRYEEKHVILITKIDHSTPYFSGTIVFSPDNRIPLGFYSEQCWTKDFTLFEGSITLTQE